MQDKKPIKPIKKNVYMEQGFGKIKNNIKNITAVAKMVSVTN